MLCPKCKQNSIKEIHSIKGIFKKRKEIYYFCCLCDFENKKTFPLSKRDVELENKERLNKKTSERIYKSERRVGNTSEL